METSIEFGYKKTMPIIQGVGLAKWKENPYKLSWFFKTNSENKLINMYIIYITPVFTSAFYLKYNSFVVY